mmetsp:Transcript_57407/g.131779  ORF Transcript_57407/g.131779 Transcript_57407/m.131779 type:complete len:283 (+) Transcript_57407:695-1543(+)
MSSCVVTLLPGRRGLRLRELRSRRSASSARRREARQCRVSFARPTPPRPSSRYRSRWRRPSRLWLRLRRATPLRASAPSSALSESDAEDEEDEEDEDDELSISGALESEHVRSCSLGSTSLSCSLNFCDIFGRDLRARSHTESKFVREQKFCVTATVTSRLSTTCHQPPGTNIVSPGRCMIVSGRWSCSSAPARAGKTFAHQAMASRPPAFFGCTTSLGTVGGSNAHNLWPCSTAFQALVPSGSMWIYEPERAEPNTNQRYGGRRRSPTSLKRSSVKYLGSA